MCLRARYLLTLLLFVSPVFATVRYVDTSATGANNGSSWASAFVYLQDALTAALAGDSIWVAAGTHYPDKGAGQNNDSRLSTFSIPSGVVVLGGFSGSESSAAERDWSANVTILSGAIDGNVDTAGNAYRVVVFSQVSEQTVLDGFTVTAGCAGMGAGGYGGGVWIYAGGANGRCDPHIVNCTISGNSADIGGGGIYTYAGQDGTIGLTLTNCTISDNSASYGGGMYHYGRDGGVNSSVLTGCIISGNHARTGGGGIICNGSNNGTSSPTMINCTISANSAQSGGAGLYISSLGGTSSPT
ncbi:MAG: hypothetical protein GF331_21775, partial [Chitinivibrionales bacterium]|nr:hypothetical protein [Chitinivibrionales bacterium]